MAAAFAARESDRLFWFDGAAVWIEPGRDADARGEEGQQIYSERREDVDHQRIDRGHRGRVGQRRRRQGARVSGGKRHTGIQDLGRARKWSLRASVTSGLAFTDCEIPEENLLPGVVGLKGPLSCLNQARYGIGWGALGAAMACYDTALQYAKTRKQFANKPIASHQLVQEKLAWMITE